MAEVISTGKAVEELRYYGPMVAVDKGTRPSQAFESLYSLVCKGISLGDNTMSSVLEIPPSSLEDHRFSQTKLLPIVSLASRVSIQDPRISTPNDDPQPLV